MPRRLNRKPYPAIFRISNTGHVILEIMDWRLRLEVCPFGGLITVFESRSMEFDGSEKMSPVNGLVWPGFYEENAL